MIKAAIRYKPDTLLERLVNRGIAHQFNNYETDNPELLEPTSLRGHFYIAHKKVRAIMECKNQSKCKITHEMKESAANSIRQLDLVSDAFVDLVSQMFLYKTFDLEQFKVSVTKDNVTDAIRQTAD